jgi:hypothetical protein
MNIKKSIKALTRTEEKPKTAKLYFEPSPVASDIYRVPVRAKAIPPRYNGRRVDQ